jgi:nucleotide-binding universal stress UspA family protein
VLCPVDFSEPSRRALRYAAAFAAHVEASLTVLFVNAPLLSTAAAAAGYDERRLGEQTERQLRRFVAQSLSTRGAASRVDYVVALGDPSREIARHTKRIGAGLVVMGTHGLRGPRKLLLGSTTERTLRAATVPVLAIPHHVPRQPARDWPAGPLIAGIDLGAGANRDLHSAAAFARVLDADLLLVHVLAAVQAPAWIRLRSSDADETRSTRARARLARLAAEIDDVDVSFRTMRGDPAPTLARVARTTKAGTLMLVLRRGPGVFGMARGTVTYHVLTSAVTPVLAVPSSLSAARLAREWGVRGR